MRAFGFIMNCCMIFKEGDSYYFNGFTCDMKKVSISQVEYHLNNGWHSTWPPKIEDEPKPELTNDQVREMAKNANIDGWETKRISTLLGLLNADNEE